MAGGEATGHGRDLNYQGRVGIAESTAAAGEGRKKTPRQPPGGGEGPQAPWQQTPPPRYHRPPRKPVHSWVGIGWVILVLLIIGLWAGKLASNPQPRGGVQLTCPAGPMWAPLQKLCQNAP